jgi:hypothetical protein
MRIIKTFVETLKKIQQTLKAPKSQKNTFGNYMYRSCEDILEAVKPLLGEAVLTITDEMVQLGDRFYVKATVTFEDGKYTKSVSAFARESLTKKGMDESQITGASSSYARKYALNGLFLIDDTKDADTQDNSKEESKPIAKVEAPKVIKKILTAFGSAEKAINDCDTLEKLSAVTGKIQKSTVLSEEEKKTLTVLAGNVYDELN